jgi:ribulose-phosphate 3-epimerase
MNADPVHPVVLAPSLLAGDHAMLALSAREIARTGLEWAHLDIMDGHFVDNLTFGPGMLAALRRHEPELFYDVHLMLSEPWKYTDAFIKAGAGLVSFHIEVEMDHAALLASIRESGAKCGLVINPATPAESVRHLLHLVDLVLVMTVQPGRGGQPFRHAMLPKIAALTAWRRQMGLSFRIEVDGGIDSITAPLCLAQGADTLVAGTAFFNAPDKILFARSICSLQSD